jgi:hypothetical protein
MDETLPTGHAGGSLHSFTARVVFAWLFVLLVMLFSKQMLFTGLLSEPGNGHLIVRPLLQHTTGALIADLLLTTACLMLIFLPRLWLPVITVAAGFALLEQSYVTAWSDKLVWWGCVAAALVVAVRHEKTLLTVLECWRLLGIVAVVFAEYKIISVLLRGSLGHWAAVIAGGAALLTALLMQRDKQRIFSLLLAATAIAGMRLLFHLNTPLLLCTIIFAPFLNWPNLHRFFVRRFEPV